MFIIYLKITYLTINIIKNRFSVLFYRIFKFGKPQNIILRNGIKLKTRKHLTNDLSIITEIWEAKPYTGQIFFAIRPTDIVFDIGGHMGNFALYAGLLATKGHIHVFEPTQENFALLKHNITHNHCKNITINNCAVGDKNTTIQFIESHNDKASHSKFSEITHGETTKVDVEQITLASYIENNHISHINFLKLDCEGAEYEILYTLSDNYLHRIEKISMEIHDNIPGYNRQQIIDFLEKKGFYVDIKEVYINIFNIFALNKNFHAENK